MTTIYLETNWYFICILQFAGLAKVSNIETILSCDPKKWLICTLCTLLSISSSKVGDIESRVKPWTDNTHVGYVMSITTRYIHRSRHPSGATPGTSYY